MAGRQLLDTRSEAKLDTFNGDRQKFEQWAFLFQSYAHLLGWGVMVDRARTKVNPIALADLGEEARAIGLYEAPLPRHIVRGSAHLTGRAHVAPPRARILGSTLHQVAINLVILYHGTVRMRIQAPPLLDPQHRLRGARGGGLLAPQGSNVASARGTFAPV